MSKDVRTCVCWMHELLTRRIKPPRRDLRAVSSHSQVTPLYDTSTITVPMGLFVGGADTLIDVPRLLSLMPAYSGPVAIPATTAGEVLHQPAPGAHAIIVRTRYRDYQRFGAAAAAATAASAIGRGAGGKHPTTMHSRVRSAMLGEAGDKLEDIVTNSTSGSPAAPLHETHHRPLRSLASEVGARARPSSSPSALARSRWDRLQHLIMPPGVTSVEEVKQRLDNLAIDDDVSHGRPAAAGGGAPLRHHRRSSTVGSTDASTYKSGDGEVIRRTTSGTRIGREGAISSGTGAGGGRLTQDRTAPMSGRSTLTSLVDIGAAAAEAIRRSASSAGILGKAAAAAAATAAAAAAPHPHPGGASHASRRDHHEGGAPCMHSAARTHQSLPDLALSLIADWVRGDEFPHDEDELQSALRDARNDDDDTDSAGSEGSLSPGDGNDDDATSGHRTGSRVAGNEEPPSGQQLRRRRSGAHGNSNAAQRQSAAEGAPLAQSFYADEGDRSRATASPVPSIGMNIDSDRDRTPVTAGNAHQHQQQQKSPPRQYIRSDTGATETDSRRGSPPSLHDQEQQRPAPAEALNVSNEVSAGRGISERSSRLGPVGAAAHVQWESTRHDDDDNDEVGFDRSTAHAASQTDPSSMTSSSPRRQGKSGGAAGAVPATPPPSSGPRQHVPRLQQQQHDAHPPSSVAAPPSSAASPAPFVLERHPPFLFIEPLFEHLDYLWARTVTDRAFPATIALLDKYRHRQAMIGPPRQAPAVVPFAGAPGIAHGATHMEDDGQGLRWRASHAPVGVGSLSSVAGGVDTARFQMLAYPGSGGYWSSNSGSSIESAGHVRMPQPLQHEHVTSLSSAPPAMG